MKEETTEPKRLYRSRQDKVIAGVCGGIAEYFNMDPVWIRLVAVLLVLAHGIGILVYIVAWILVPKNPYQKEGKKTKSEKIADKIIDTDKTHKEVRKGNAAVIFGIILVFLGIAFLMDNLFDWFNFNYVWPLAIITIGLYILMRRKNGEE
jgi:phage shock protein C